MDGLWSICYVFLGEAEHLEQQEQQEQQGAEDQQHQEQVEQVEEEQVAGPVQYEECGSDDEGFYSTDDEFDNELNENEVDNFMKMNSDDVN